MKKMNFTKVAVALAALGVSANVLAAKYEVKEVAQSELYTQSFGVTLNDIGDVLSVSQTRINLPTYFVSSLTSAGSLLRVTCNVSQEEVDSQQLDADSLACLRTELVRTDSQSGGRFAFNASFQKLGAQKTYYYGPNNDEGHINLLDIYDETLGNLTNSNTEVINAINNNGIAVGKSSAPYVYGTWPVKNSAGEDITYDLFTRSFSNRAVIYTNGNVFTIDPLETKYGGVSVANDISDTGYVAGYQSVGIYGDYETNIEETCATEEFPKLVCEWNTTVRNNVYELRPVVWKIDSDYNVVETTIYNLPFTPTDTYTANYVAVATAVNDSGIAVGYGKAPAFNSNSLTTVLDYPVLYREGQSKHILTEEDGFDRGYALDINNDNIVVGYVEKFFDGNFNDSFFVYNADTGLLETPTAFYKDGQAIAHAINDNGFVVGEGEYEITTASVRRKHGFLYNIDTKEFFDLNDFLACDSAYEIVEARDINNNNEIVATALKAVTKVNALGEAELDENGEQIITPVQVSVLLSPISAGKIETCAGDEEQYERKGFSFNYYLVALLTGLVVIRRRFL